MESQIIEFRRFGIGTVDAWWKQFLRGVCTLIESVTGAIYSFDTVNKCSVNIRKHRRMHKLRKQE